MEITIKDWFFRGGVAASLLSLIAVFASADNGYCTLEISQEIAARKALNCAEYWLNRYQGGLGALATLAAAVLAFYAVQRQIAQNERLDAERRSREADASRAVLPLTLSIISAYAMKCIEVLRDRIPHDPSNGQKPVEFPAFPDSTIRTLQENVKSGTPDLGIVIGNLISNAQIQNSRLADLRKDLTSAISKDFHMLRLQQGLFDACGLYARAGKLYNHARGNFDRYGITYNEYYNSSVLGGLDLGELPVLKRYFEAASQLPPDHAEGL